MVQNKYLHQDDKKRKLVVINDDVNAVVVEWNSNETEQVVFKFSFSFNLLLTRKA